MKAALVLARSSLRRLRALLVATCGILFLLQILLTLVASSFERSGSFSQLARFIPDFIRPLVDSTFMSVLSFSGMVCIGYAHVIVLFFLVSLAIVAGTEPVGEIDSKFVDLVMCRPVPRNAMITRSIVVMMVVTAAPVATMLAGSWFGLATIAPKSAAGPTVATLLSLAVNLEMVTLACGAIALAVAAFAKRRATAGAVAGLVAFATFLVDYLARVWSPLKGIARFSPFHYFNPLTIIAGGALPPANIAILAAAFLAGCAVAYALYQKRDL